MIEPYPSAVRVSEIAQTDESDALAERGIENRQVIETAKSLGELK
jgi:hypothetical protein